MEPPAPKPLVGWSKAVLDTQDDYSNPENPFLDPPESFSRPCCGRTIQKEHVEAVFGEPFRGVESTSEFLRLAEKKKGFLRSTTEEGKTAAQNMKTRVSRVLGWKDRRKEAKKDEKGMDRRETLRIAEQNVDDGLIPTVATDPTLLRANKLPPPPPPKPKNTHPLISKEDLRGE